MESYISLGRENQLDFEQIAGHISYLRFLFATVKMEETVRRCKRCGNEFTTTIPNKIYCCLSCQDQSAKKKKCLSSKKLLYWQILNRDNFTCQYCGKNPTQHDVILHVDHIKPRIDGGKYELDNLVTACDRCNLLKGHRPLRYEAAFKKRLKKKTRAKITQESFNFYRGMIDK